MLMKYIFNVDVRVKLQFGYKRRDDIYFREVRFTKDFEVDFKTWKESGALLDEEWRPILQW